MFARCHCRKARCSSPATTCRQVHNFTCTSVPSLESWHAHKILHDVHCSSSVYYQLLQITKIFLSPTYYKLSILRRHWFKASHKVSHPHGFVSYSAEKAGIRSGCCDDLLDLLEIRMGSILDHL